MDDELTKSFSLFHHPHAPLCMLWHVVSGNPLDASKSLTVQRRTKCQSHLDAFEGGGQQQLVTSVYDELPQDGRRRWRPPGPTTARRAMISRARSALRYKKNESDSLAASLKERDLGECVQERFSVVLIGEKRLFGNLYLEDFVRGWQPRCAAGQVLGMVFTFSRRLPCLSYKIGDTPRPVFRILHPHFVVVASGISFLGVSRL